MIPVGKTFSHGHRSVRIATALLAESRVLLLALLGLLASCTQQVIEEEGYRPSSELCVLTRSSSDISYPISLYAFDLASGELASSVQITSATEAPLLSLVAGEYQIVAVAGIDRCRVGASPRLTDHIVLPDAHRLDTPLQMGSATVNVSQSTTASITLYNQVAAVDLMLADIPDEATAVSVTLAMQHNAVAFDGTLEGSTATTVTLVKEGAHWVAPRFYVMPSSGGYLTMSITTKAPAGTQTYGYTYPGKLEANVPYVFSGSFQSGFGINGVIALAGWESPKEVTFSFGPGSAGDDDVSGPADDLLPTYTVAALPDAATLWGSHLVAAVQHATDYDAELLLLSTAEWTDITSSTHAETPGMASDIAVAYREDDLEGWHIPTRDEAKLMHLFVGLESLDETNEALYAYNLVPLSVGENATGEKVRYLCDDATYTYVWDATMMSKAGTKRTYHLRLVKWVRVELLP